VWGERCSRWVGAKRSEAARDFLRDLPTDKTNPITVGTTHWTEGAVCFQRILGELGELMKSKGYGRIEDFRGKLKEYKR